MRLVILTDSALVAADEAAAKSDWHLAQLLAAGRARGWRVAACPLQSLTMELGGDAGKSPRQRSQRSQRSHRSPIIFPKPLMNDDILLSSDTGLPDAVLVRTIAAGSFEQITFRLGLLHGLQRLGVKVVNSARAIESCVDKSMTSLLLSMAQLPQPRSWVGELRETLEAAAAQDCDRWVAKPLFGAMGKGLQLLTKGETPIDKIDYHGVWYLQEYIESQSHNGSIDSQRSETVSDLSSLQNVNRINNFAKCSSVVDTRTTSTYSCDYRLMVAGNRLVAAMRRENSHWITNVAQGATCFACQPTTEMESLAIAACRAVAADYAGVDLIIGQDGRCLILEVNSMPAWRGLQSVVKFNIAERLLSHIL